jgi:hypothetical protein
MPRTIRARGPKDEESGFRACRSRDEEDGPSIVKVSIPLSARAQRFRADDAPLAHGRGKALAMDPRLTLFQHDECLKHDRRGRVFATERMGRPRGWRKPSPSGAHGRRRGYPCVDRIRLDVVCSRIVVSSWVASATGIWGGDGETGGYGHRGNPRAMLAVAATRG